MAKEQLHILMEACYFQAQSVTAVAAGSIEYSMFSHYLWQSWQSTCFEQPLHTPTEMPWRLAWMTWLQPMAKGEETDFSSFFWILRLWETVKISWCERNFGFIPRFKFWTSCPVCQLSCRYRRCRKFRSLIWQTKPTSDALVGFSRFLVRAMKMALSCKLAIDQAKRWNWENRRGFSWLPCT